MWRWSSLWWRHRMLLRDGHSPRCRLLRRFHRCRARESGERVNHALDSLHPGRELLIVVCHERFLVAVVRNQLKRKGGVVLRVLDVRHARALQLIDALGLPLKVSWCFKVLEVRAVAHDPALLPRLQARKAQGRAAKFVQNACLARDATQQLKLQLLACRQLRGAPRRRRSRRLGRQRGRHARNGRLTPFGGNWSYFLEKLRAVWTSIKSTHGGIHHPL